LVRQTLQSILKDEVEHSRLGWAFLAEASRSNWQDRVGPWLPSMLMGTFSRELFATDPDRSEPVLAGLGSLERVRRRRVVCETLEQVVFPGLERFGVETTDGRSWLAARMQAASQCQADRAGG
jgi:hypothetical protein